MAFKNPSLISSFPREEFDELKEQVDKNTIDIEKLKKQYLVKDTNGLDMKEDLYIMLDKDIQNAKLGGVPRIDYFKFECDKKLLSEKNEKVDNTIELDDILDQVNDLTSQISNQTVNANSETIGKVSIDTPEVQKQEGDESNIDFEGVIDISTIVNDNKKYRIRNDIVINNAKTLSGHRTYFISDEKLNKIKTEYISSSKTIAA